MRTYDALTSSPVAFAKTTCNLCDSDIPVTADRYHCLDCHQDFCNACKASQHAHVQGHPAFHLCVVYPGLKTPDDSQRKDIISAWREDLERNQRFGAAATFFSDYALAILDAKTERLGLMGETATYAELALNRIIELRSMGRFVDFFARRTLAGTVLGGGMQVFSQGVSDANRWKGIPLLKGVYDFALYPLMLNKIQPATIFEFGSEAGGSACWLADLTASFDIDCHVYSVDLNPPSLKHERITFIQGDSRSPEIAFPAELLLQAPHPWLIVEDSHVNIQGILEYFSKFMQPGDYFIIEDENAESDIGKHLLMHPGQYWVDTFFTDYFGYNATCSSDQILAFKPPIDGIDEKTP
ncbi:Cephalosporin hydroxylase family protein [Pseudomonas amygdali pv. hibisci]|uniref:Cephalosporin hydroxylase family protein n=1 Tax=Pseudomonas amygdali pv. hibisci TaxID=251723 RepID=A0AB34U135_PSEA0|nr:Cephalosporin hydroxylase family protein [Pseudomonas amygdali pv. hibisci]